MNLVEKLKGIIKKPADKETFGTDPKDPWSARANIAESASLDVYLKSRGINPQFVSTQQKISHAKSAAFLKWKQQHQNEELQTETMTSEPSATHKRKAAIKSSEHAHKEIKTPRGPGYHEEVKGNQNSQLTPEAVEEAKTTQGTALDKFRQAAAEREKKHAEIEKKQSKSGEGMTAAIDRLQKHLNKEEVSQKEVDKFHKKLDKLVHSSFGKSSTEKKMKEEVEEVDEDYVKELEDGLKKLENHDYDTIDELMQKIAKKHNMTGKDLHNEFKYKHGKKPDDWIKEQVELDEDLRQWFKQKWVRMDTKGNIKGQCAREPGEGKPKCLPQAKAHALGKEKRAAAAQRKRREDPNPERKGKAINVKTEELDLNYISQEELIEAALLEKNKPTQPEKWARAKAAAKAKFSVYPSAYANAWAAKKYKSMGGGWRSTKEELELEDVEQIDELKKDTLKSYRDKSMVSLKNARKNRDAAEPGMHMSKGFADLHAKSDAITKKRAKGLAGYLQRKHGMKPGYSDDRKTTSEDVGDSKAAVNADGLPNPQLEPVSERKKQMSKSARMIKALYKKKRMVKEDLYDHEKEDKSVAPYGKKPKMEVADKKDSIGEKKPQAAATLSGGKTLTGSERDTVEIDPMMRNRPGQPDVTKKDDKKDDKKEDKKKDK